MVDMLFRDSMTTLHAAAGLAGSSMLSKKDVRDGRWPIPLVELGCSRYVVHESLEPASTCARWTHGERIHGKHRQFPRGFPGLKITKSQS